VLTQLPQLFVQRMQRDERRTIAVPDNLQLPDYDEQHGHLPAEHHGQPQLPERRGMPDQRQSDQCRAAGENAQTNGQDQPGDRTARAAG